MHRYTSLEFPLREDGDEEEMGDGANVDDCASKYPCHMEKEIMLQLGKALIATAEQI